MDLNSDEMLVVDFALDVAMARWKKFAGFDELSRELVEGCMALKKRLEEQAQ